MKRMNSEKNTSRTGETLCAITPVLLQFLLLLVDNYSMHACMVKGAITCVHLY